jgi:hypothetical protein
MDLKGIPFLCISIKSPKSRDTVPLIHGSTRQSVLIKTLENKCGPQSTTDLCTNNISLGTSSSLHRF